MNPFTALKDKFLASRGHSDDEKDSPSLSHQITKSPSSSKIPYPSAIPTKPISSISISPLLKDSPAKPPNEPIAPLSDSEAQLPQSASISHKPHSKSHEFRKRMKRSRNRSTQNLAHQRATLIADYLGRVPIFSRIPQSDRMNLAKVFQQRIYHQHQIIIRQNDMGSEFFIITKGTATVHVSTSRHIASDRSPNDSPNNSRSDIVATLHPGDYFGETSLLTNQPRNASVEVTSEEMHCLALDKSSFVRLFGTDRVRVNFGKRGVTFLRMNHFYSILLIPDSPRMSTIKSLHSAP